MCPSSSTAPDKARAIYLRDKYNCPIKLCLEAVQYAKEHNGDETMELAYLKAKSFAVKTTCSFDDRVRRFMKGD